MGIWSLSSLFKKRSVEASTTLANPASWLLDSYGSRSKAGSSVSIDSSFGNSTIWAAYSVLSRTVASLPLNVYIRDKNGDVHIDEGPLNEMISQEPNEYTSAYNHQEETQVDFESSGNSYERIFRNRRSGDIEAIERCTCDRVTVLYRYDKNDRLDIKYKILVNNLIGARKEIILDHDEIIHNKGMSKDGILGRSPILTCLESVGIWEAVRDYASYYYANGAKPSGVFEWPAGVKITDEQVNQFLRIYQQYNAGAKNSGMPMITNGFTYNTVQANPDSAQLIEMAKLSMEQVGQLYGIPQHLLNNLDRATNNNIEQQTTDFAVHTIRPRLKRRENEYNRKLFLTSTNRKKKFVRYNLDSLLRGDTATRVAMYQFMVSIGAMNADDVLAMEHRNSLKDSTIGKKYYISQNLRPADEPWNAPAASPVTDTNQNKDGNTKK